MNKELNKNVAEKIFINVGEAQEIISSVVKILLPKTLSLNEAAGFTLAADVFASLNIPAFQQSSMDGYAINFENIHEELLIKGEMAAGANNQFEIKSNEAARIFTGAPLPLNADTVVPQEMVAIKDGTIVIDNKNLHKGIFIRAEGSEIKAGELALKEATFLSPSALGFLAGIGINKVEVYPAPKVAVIITGNELQKPGNDLSAGQVYESNSFSLTAALKQTGIKEVQIINAKDDLNITQSCLKDALKYNDVVLLTGGVSVGDYDFVVAATEHCKVKKHFHKIKQRPGKPLYFGSQGNKLVFGLPGNPASVLICFYEYVLPALEKMMKKKNSIQKKQAFLQSDFEKKKGLTHFLKGMYEDEKVTILSSQASFQLRSFAEANCLIVIDEDVEYAAKGTTVEVHLLPQ